MNTLTLTTQHASAADVLAQNGRASLADSTKRKYGTAVTHYLDLELEVTTGDFISF